MKRFVNKPKLRDSGEYDQAIADFVEVAAEMEGVVSVYTAGTVSQPGISDLDFVVCLADSLPVGFDLEAGLSALTRELIGSGSVLKVTEQQFSDVLIIDDFPLQWVWGKQFSLNVYEGAMWEVCRILDWLPERLYATGRLLAAPEIDVIWGLQVLKSLAGSLVRIDRLLGGGCGQDYLTKVMDLRAGWFVGEEQSESAFLELVEEGLMVGWGQLERFCGWLREEQLLVVGSEVVDWQWVVPGGRPALRSVEVPREVMGFLWEQGQMASGFIGDGVRESFRGVEEGQVHVEIPEQLRTVMIARMNYVESLAQWFVENGLQSGLLKYGWYLKNYELKQRQAIR